MKNRIVLLLAFVFFLSLASTATHIVGGSLTYEQLGGSTYRVTLKLYRDCSPGNAAFPGSVTIEVRRSCGTAALSDIVIPFPGASLVPPNIDTCAVNPGICLEEAVYTKVVSGLPPTAGGYDLYFQYCCRNATLLNIVAPLSAGETWYAHIPDNGVVISNSSPKWVNPPPVFVCQGNNMYVDHSATDADGDSLVYSLYTPYSDLAVSWPGCVFSTPTVTWTSTYGANNPLDAATPGSLTVSSSGILNGVPPILGQFVAGVKCEEWRNGVKIGEILRDFQFNVVNCPPLAVASFNSNGACAGTAIAFNNTTSPAANSYLWDFGDASPTSTLTSPTHIYPALGSYTATLIINGGTACADTLSQAVNISILISDFSSDAPECQGLPVVFTDTSSVDPSSSITNWDWNFGDGFTSTSQDPTHIYNAGGSFNVSLITTSAAGCKDTIVYPVNIQGSPIANAGGDTISCTNNSTITLGGTILNAGGGQWIGSLGSIFTPGSTTLNATYTPSAAAVASGSDTLLLLTTSNGLCPADTDQVIISFYAGPTVDAGADIFVCKDTASVPLCAIVTVASGGTWASTGTGTFLFPLSTLCNEYQPSTADTIAGSVILYLTSTGNGNCIASSDSTLITFTSTPISIITSGSSVCSTYPIALTASSTTGNGIWTSNGSGTFAPNDTTLNGIYTPSASDDLAGNVTLIFTSTNNGGCRSNADTINITIFPSPTAAFNSISACPQDTITFTNGSTTSTGTIVSWDWNFGDTGTSTLEDPIHIYGTGGPFNVSLIVTSSNGCVDTLTQVVNVFEKPLANFNANGICLDDGTLYTDMSTVGGGATIASWIWNYGDSSTNGTVQNPNHNFPSAGSYTTLLIVQSSQGCIDSISQVVSVLPGPGANFTADDFTGNINQTIGFSDQSTNGAISWFWDFGDSSTDSTSTLQNPTHIYGAGGFYNVCLIVTDINGCTDTICRTEIISMPPEVPSGFTPNGDGENDIFYVYGGPFKKLDFRIYNNWGELIFESSEQAKGWDGKRNNIDQAIGVYVYTVIGTTEEDKEYKLSGDVTLLR